MINLKTITKENSLLHHGPRFQGLSHGETGGRETLETSWLERARQDFASLKSKVNFTVTDSEEKVCSFGFPLIATIL